MKKISYILIAILALFSGACGGGKEVKEVSGWTAERKLSVASSYSAFIGEGVRLVCIVDYVSTHFSYDEYLSKFKQNLDRDLDDAIVIAIAKACYKDA